MQPDRTQTDFPNRTEMGEALGRDADGRFHRALLETLEARRAKAEQRLTAGLPPAEAQEAQKELAALAAARKTVEMVWQANHPGARGGA